MDTLARFVMAVTGHWTAEQTKTMSSGLLLSQEGTSRLHPVLTGGTSDELHQSAQCRQLSPYGHPSQTRLPYNVLRLPAVLNPQRSGSRHNLSTGLVIQFRLQVYHWCGISRPFLAVKGAAALVEGDHPCCVPLNTLVCFSSVLDCHHCILQPPVAAACHRHSYCKVGCLQVLAC